MVEPADVALVKQITSEDGTTCPCPSLCGGSILLVPDDTVQALSEDARLKPPTVLTGKQLYQAVMGLGLPEEIPSSAELIDSIFRANKVVSVDLEKVQEKIYLHEIRFDNGVVLHLASGLKGAQVFRVSKGVKNG